MKWNKIIEYLTNWFVTFLLVIFIIAIFIGCVRSCTQCTTPTSTPVEDIVIDSLSKANDSINSEIKYLDSIKHETINKVKVLDNDSTLKLFYELLRK